MNKIAKFLSLASLLAASAPLAMATPITGSVSLAGPDTIIFTHSGIDTIQFAVGTQNGTIITSDGDIATIVAPYTKGHLTSISSSPSAAGTTLFAIPTGTNPALKFVIDTITHFGTDVTDPAPNIEVTGTGTFYAPGYDATQGTFSLTTSRTGTTTFELNSTSIIAGPPNLTTAPEPSSLILLGTGALSAAGTMFRKRRIA